MHTRREGGTERHRAMKFTDSPVIELQVGNTRLSLQQDNGSMHVGTSVWPCSLVLVKFLDRWARPHGPDRPNNPYADLLDFRGKRAVELGAGCGAAGMGLYLLGLADIVLTDIAPVMPALRHNLKRNKPVLHKTLKTSVLYWNNSDQIKSLNPPFDIVVAADVVYIEESVRHLVEAMAALVKSDGLVLLGYQLRSPEADKLFWELCEEVFVKEKVRHEDLHPEYAYEEADVFILRKKKDKEDELSFWRGIPSLGTTSS
ncbi:protein N-lysine methyltransferase METTL21A isoform X1 [Rhodamnia argentea]|uniref:Protein N-lysine methyltransferase METTL21A isoform X1 n=1 Tax=Rhodamnia argentea TaxID=178133 RepID=A0ABM3GRS2_9MYRT|nr:protein N-lysine methyltransferase METTL21A isoform X1 [Rhodamnia argentea]